MARSWLIVTLLLAPPCESAKSGAGVIQAEIQIALCSEPEQIVQALDLAPRERSGQTWLFDDDALTLFGRDLRFRVRASESGNELTLKAAVDDCANVPRALIPPKRGKCEHDVHGDKVTAAVSLSTHLYDSDTRKLLSGRLALGDALSAPQVRYLTEAAKLWPLPPAIRPLGPIEVTSYRARDKPYDVDVSRLPSGERFVEISRKVPLADAATARSSFDDDLARRGVTVCADQSAQAVNKLRALLRSR